LGFAESFQDFVRKAADCRERTPAFVLAVSVAWPVMKIVGLIFLLAVTPACANDTNDLTPRLRDLEETLGQMEARISGR